MGPLQIGPIIGLSKIAPITNPSKIGPILNYKSLLKIIPHILPFCYESTTQFM
jgi:hypothetical protein